MKAAIVVPARFASTRYPGKPLVPLKGARGASKPLLQRSWEAARAVPGVDRVLIATDDARITEAGEAFGAEVMMTSASCRNGTERCAEVLARLEGMDVVINLQGDAPLTPPSFVTALIEAMRDGAVAVATPVLRASAPVHRRLLEDQAAGRVGGTTAAIGTKGDALYFSKSVIPHVPADRIGDPALPLYLHVGVYAYRPGALARYTALPPSPLELLEGLEQLRFLENGIPVRAVEVSAPSHDIWELNNPEDVRPIEAALAEAGLE